MRFNKTVVSLIALLLVPIGSWAGFTGSSPTWSSTPDYPSVNSCVSSAQPGDTINVSAGSATWTSTLHITKGITLIGAGIGNTVISGNNRGEDSFLIEYAPSSNNQVFRISGFTFNITNQQAIKLTTNSEPTTQTNIRIHHNRFTNSTVSRSVVMNEGCFGLIDNNTIDNVAYPFGVGNSLGSGEDAWLGYSDSFWGTADNMYVEDNTITTTGGIISDCDQGGRYVFRYNTITTGAYSWPLFDTHEWDTSGWGCMGVEIYGNTTTRGEFLLSCQGCGRNTVHHNIMPDGVINLYSDTACPDADKVPDRQKMNNNYFFLNRESATGALLAEQVVQDVCGIIIKNSRYWMDNTNCIAPNICTNITTGIGCGTLANRPTSCTTGVGYWATNQSCTDLTGMVGRNPTNPISGTLYKCTATNTWTAYYTPYAYPHPLRTDTRPSPPSNLRIIPQQ